MRYREAADVGEAEGVEQLQCFRECGAGSGDVIEQEDECIGVYFFAGFFVGMKAAGEINETLAFSKARLSWRVFNLF